MTKTDTRDCLKTSAQINKLEAEGCDIIRCAVLDEAAAKNIKNIKKKIKIPLIADIHFNHKLAIMAIESGADKIRINPGNIGADDRVKEIIAAARSANVPIRIGVNAGSIEKYTKMQRGESSRKIAEKMTKKAVSYIRLFERSHFSDIVLSLKSSDVLTTIEAYRMMAGKCEYPFHVGVTEAGTCMSGSIKSSIGIGILLSEGIGDTIRVSLADDPLNEIRAGKLILKTVKAAVNYPDLIVCPTCGRCTADVFGIAKKVEVFLSKIKKPLKIAVMGCPVNGPGEAKEADLGLACGKGYGLIFKNGVIIKKAAGKDMLKSFLDELKKA
jgi:(E)-4-hydroxy-3-methylbut-2-enyl-diphosphate synthase